MADTDTADTDPPEQRVCVPIDGCVPMTGALQPRDNWILPIPVACELLLAPVTVHVNAQVALLAILRPVIVPEFVTVVPGNAIVATLASAVYV